MTLFFSKNIHHALPLLPMVPLLPLLRFSGPSETSDEESINELMFGMNLNQNESSEEEQYYDDYYYDEY